MAKVTTPQEFFGFQMGADYKLARWDKIVEYFGKLVAESDRIKVIDMGKSTEGNPFLLAIISSPANLAKLEHYREISLKLGRPARPNRRPRSTSWWPGARRSSARA